MKRSLLAAADSKNTLHVSMVTLMPLASARAFPADGQRGLSGSELDAGHPWRPPFRLDRVGQPIAVVVEASARPGDAIYRLEAFSNGKLVGGQALHFPETPPYSARVTLDGRHRRR